MIPLRLARELTYQLEKAGENERLARTLGKIPVLFVLWNENESTVYSLWEELSLKNKKPEMYYSIESILRLPRTLRSNALFTLQVFFIGRAGLPMASQFAKELLVWAEAHGDKQSEKRARIGLGNISARRGDFNNASEHFNKALFLAEELGDISGTAAAIGSLGVVHYNQGKFSEALSNYKRLLEISETLGERSSMARALGNMVNVLTDQGRYVEALECFERNLSLYESLGDKRGMANALGSKGGIHFRLGQHSDGLKYYRLALQGHREIGFGYGVSYWLEGIALSLLYLAVENPLHGGLGDARKHAEEFLRLSEELARPDFISGARLILARIDAAEGNKKIATEKLQSMLTKTTDEDFLAELHYWLWKVAGNDENHNEALTRYTNLYTGIPNFEFRKRIAELKGERIPLSADDLEEVAA